MDHKWLPFIHADRCTGCRRCVDACGPRCLEMAGDLAVLACADTCGSEEHCVAACEEDAIVMVWVPLTEDASTGKWRRSADEGS